MKFLNFQSNMAIDTLIKRSTLDNRTITTQVQTIIEEVRSLGDEALKMYTRKFDGVCLNSLIISKKEMIAAEARISRPLKEAIQLAISNVKAFHEAQKPADINVEVMQGVFCRQTAVPVERVGLYVPGGTAPLFSSVIMLALPAVLAGCREIVLVTPPNKTGTVPDEILYAALAVGLDRVYCVGGAQAIAGLTFGTQTIPKVDKILGPGNQFVTVAKQLAFLQGVAIDMPAGPSEVAVIADETAVSQFVAADLLSQAEHGSDSQVVLICTSNTKIREIENELNEALKVLPR
ncbi:MAG: histidinol dehydrogenase, partial [Salinivirgaceae bacterium]